MSPRLNSIVGELWLWCMNSDITLVAEHLPGALNTIADKESQVMRGRSDWILNPKVFHKIQQKWGLLEVDLFASRLTTQLKRFWMPSTRTGAAYRVGAMPISKRSYSRQSAEQSAATTN